MTDFPTYSILSAASGVTELHLAGYWKITCSRRPSFAEILDRLGNDCRQLVVLTEKLAAWDSLLIVFLSRLESHCRAQGIAVDFSNLPDGAAQLLQLSDTGREQDNLPVHHAPGPLARLGEAVIGLYESGHDLARFAGEIILELFQVLRGRSYFRKRDFWYFLQACGAEALPIVSLISVLVGVILGFVGAIQLSMFGAQIYVANLVALAMVLEMGAMMSGVIMAGRTGAAYAAQLGTMQVSEEIDALQTMGISPVGFLVLPRMFALVLMMPLLCVYADLLGIAGGTLIGVSMLDLSLVEYLNQTRHALNLQQCSQGIIKSAVYGVLVGFSGCYQGIRCGRSASAVGEATTRAVVMSIVLIVIADAIMTMLFNYFKIGVG